MRDKVIGVLLGGARHAPEKNVCTASLVCTGFHNDSVAVIFPHFGPYISHARKDLLPSSLAEIFYLVEQFDLPALAQLLATDPAAASIRDEEGATLLHVALEWCGLLELPHESASAAATLPVSGVLQSVAALTSLLLAHGCAPQLPTLYGLWPLDVVSMRRAVAFKGEHSVFDPVLEFIASVLVSQKEIIHCCLPL